MQWVACTGRIASQTIGTLGLIEVNGDLSWRGNPGIAMKGCPDGQPGKGLSKDVIGIWEVEGIIHQDGGGQPGRCQCRRQEMLIKSSFLLRWKIHTRIVQRHSWLVLDRQDTERNTSARIRLECFHQIACINGCVCWQQCS